MANETSETDEVRRVEDAHDTARNWRAKTWRDHLLVFEMALMSSAMRSIFTLVS